MTPDGEVVSTRPVQRGGGHPDRALDQFRGPIMQVPSMHPPSSTAAARSAIHAREGSEI